MLGNGLSHFYYILKVCSNAARIYVHESIFDEFLEEVVKAAKKLRIGDTMDGRSQIGALISQDHFDKVTGFIDRAVGEVIVFFSFWRFELIDKKSCDTFKNEMSMGANCGHSNLCYSFNLI